MEARLDYYTASPQALKGMLMLEAATFGLSIEKPLLELIRIRVSQLNQCGFCTDMHSMAARQRGESERRLFALCVWRDSPFFNPREKSALAWSESVATLPTSRVPDELFAAMRVEFSEQELVDLTMAVSSISAWNRLAVGFRQQPPND
jgi:AhpD family alkylhydroperoxidase